jgi:hypothetical protein
LSSFSSPSSSSDTDTATTKLPSYYKEPDELPKKSFLERLQDLWYERSGTSEIIALKESVNEASLEFDQASTKVTFARRHLDESLRKWERTSGQHLQLLQRRESWNQNDAQEFANLVSQEITNRNALEQARKDLARTEETLSKKQLEYMNRMRRRYHEEQIWQDQWRVLGTYGTWSLIVLNSCVFLASQYFLRLRENARMKAIEELIRDNTAAIANYNNDIMGASATDTKELSRLYNVEVEHQERLLEEEAKSRSSAREDKEMDQDDTKKGTHDSPATTSALWNKEQLLLHWQELKSKTKHGWETLKSTSKEMTTKVKTKTERIVASLPGSVVEAIPKSPSDVDIPSVIIGSAATGVAFVLVMVLFPNNRSNR